MVTGLCSCRVCRSFRIRAITLLIAEYERGRDDGYREHAELTEALYDRLAPERPSSRVCLTCKGIGRANEQVCQTCYGTGEEKI